MTRRRLTPTQKAEIVSRQNHECPECCKSLTGAARVEWDHILPLALGGEDEPENIQCLHARCHRLKTNSDVGRIAKSDRMGGKTGQRKRRLTGATQKIPSRPFGGASWR